MMTSNTTSTRANAGQPGKNAPGQDEQQANPRYQQDFLNDSGWDNDPLDQNQLAYQPGEKIGERVVIKELGRGGMGIVYLTERRKQSFTCQEALKVSLNLSEPLRFQREVKLLSKLNHPSICKIIDVGVTRSNDPYFVMEHIDGMPVTQFCQKEITSIAKVLTLFIDICEAIEYIHSEGVIHRDIKPSNILALKLGGIRVLDFGIAKFLNKRSDTFNTDMHVPFTPAYASPEQRNPSSDPNEMSDIYSLGVLFIEILNGGLTQEQRDDLCTAIQELERYAWEMEGVKVSDNLKRILGKMVVHHREQRYRTAKDVLAELNEELRVVRGQEVLSHIRVLEKDNELAMLNRMDADAELVRLKNEIEMAKLLKKQMIIEGECTKRLSDQIADLSIQVKRRLRSGKLFQKGDIFEGRFELVSFIKSGGFGSVWKGIDLNREELVAIKILHHQFSADLTRRERFFRGARKMMQLKHSHIVEVILEEGFHDGIFYFVMAYCSGGDLQEAVHTNALRPSECLTVLSQIADALQYAHAEGVIHRDVKPGNILLDANKNAKLTDFDLVHVLDETGGTRTGALGSFIFSAPETMENAQNASPASDLYSLGMSAIFCLASKNLSVDVLRDPAGYVQTMAVPTSLRKAVLTAIAFNKADRAMDLPRLKREFDDAGVASKNPPTIFDKSRRVLGLATALLVLACTASLFLARKSSPQAADPSYVKKKKVLDAIISDISFENDVSGSKFLFFSADGSRVVNMLNEKKLGFWKIHDGSLDTTYELPTMPRHMYFSKDSDDFTYVDDNGVIYYGNTRKPAELRNISQEIGVHASGLSKRAFIDPKRHLLIIPDTNAITVYNLLKRDIRVNQRTFIKSRSVAFTPSSGTLAFVSGNNPETQAHGTNAIIFDYTQGKVATVLPVDEADFIYEFFISSDNKFISGIGINGTITTYDINQKKLLSKISIPKERIKQIHFIQDTTDFIICSADQQVSRWNFINGTNLKLISDNKFTSYPSSFTVGCDNDLAWTDFAGRTVVLDINSGQIVQRIERHTPKVFLSKYSHRKQGIVDWQSDNKYRQQFNLLSDHHIATYDAMGLLGFAGEKDEIRIEIKGEEVLARNTNTDTILYIAKPKPGYHFTTMKTDTAGDFFAITQELNIATSSVVVHNIHQKKKILECPISSYPKFQLQNWQNQRSISIQDNGTLKFFDLDSGKLAHLIGPRPDIQTHGSATNHAFFATVSGNRKLSVFKMDDFKPTSLFETEELQGFVSDITFSEDGKHLFLAADSFCKMYDTMSGTLLFSQPGYFSSGVFTKDGKHVAATKNYKEIIFFDSTTGKRALTFRPVHYHDWFAFTEDGFFAGSEAVVDNLFDRTKELTREERDFIRLKYEPHITAQALVY